MTAVRTVRIGGFHADVCRNFNEMQMIFNALSGSSGQVPVTPIGGNRMYLICSTCVYRASQANSCTLEKAPQPYNVRHPRVL